MYDFEIRALMLKGLAELWVRLGTARIILIAPGSYTTDTPKRFNEPRHRAQPPWPDAIGVHVSLAPGVGGPVWHEHDNECSLESVDADGNATTWCHIVRDGETRSFHWECSLERAHEGEADSLELAQLCGVATILRFLPEGKPT